MITANGVPILHFRLMLASGVACAAMLVPAVVAAEGVTVFGNARLGLGYNVLQSGVLTTGDTTDADGNPLPLGEIGGLDELRVISRVRFGVTMSGETPNGVGFGATIRADNASGGNAGTRGSVFVSSDLGSLTAGDTLGADGFRVGEVPSIGLTGFGEFERPRYLSNAGLFDWDTQTFLGSNERRPTLRYDYDFDRFGLSISTNRRVKDVVLGANARFEFAGGEVVAGLGYGRIEEYVSDRGLTIPSVDQYSGSLRGTFGDLSAMIVYTYAEGRSGSDSELESIVGSLGYTRGDLTLRGLYHGVQKASGPEDFAFVDGSDAWGLGFSYRLGGGATLAGGYLRDFAENNRADFGINLSF